MVDDYSNAIRRRDFLRYGLVLAGGATAAYLGYKFLYKPRTYTQPYNSTNTTSATTAVEPLAIEYLRWNPTRIVNSKVYDGTVSFAVDNLDPLNDQITLNFDTIYPPEIPQTAFTSEPDKSYSFAATSKKQAFSQDVADLVGGRQYRAIATVKDKNGNETVDYADTPYIREFEKFASKDVTVGVQYGTWWNYQTWRKVNPTVTPLLGNYDSGDMFVVNKQIDMLTGFGGNAFLSFLTDSYSDYLTSNMFDSPLINDAQIGLTYHVDYRLLRQEYAPVDLDDQNIRNSFESDLRYLAQKYFGRKNYLRINGMPALYLYQARTLSGNVETRIKEIKESLRKETGYDIFLIGDTIIWNSPDGSRIRPYDAITKWTSYYKDDGDRYDFPDGIDNNEDNLRHLYQMWSSYAHQLGVHFIPSAMPGFVTIYPPQSDKPVLSKSTKRFADQLKVGMDFLDDEIRCLFVTSWNDYAENTNIEPTVQEGYSYLKILRDAVST
jgi:hypothetical protein